MSKNNEYRKIKKGWSYNHEAQRAAGKEFYKRTDDSTPYRKKSAKSGNPRSNHKHLYIDAVIIDDIIGREVIYNGRVCSICGREHPDNRIFVFEAAFSDNEPMRDGLPVYKSAGNGKARLIKK